jgi:uncharacterized protein YrzB (UPF0473 family)
MSGENEEIDEDLADDLDDGEEADIVELEDENGNKVQFVVLMIAEVDGKEYAALTPAEQTEEGEEGEEGEEEDDDDDDAHQDIFLFEYEQGEEDGEPYESFQPIEDEATFEKVQAYIAEQMELLAGL